jgi:hypothetical protein
VIGKTDPSDGRLTGVYVWVCLRERSPRVAPPAHVNSAAGVHGPREAAEDEDQPAGRQAPTLQHLVRSAGRAVHAGVAPGISQAAPGARCRSGRVRLAASALRRHCTARRAGRHEGWARAKSASSPQQQQHSRARALTHQLAVEQQAVQTTGKSSGSRWQVRQTAGQAAGIPCSCRRGPSTALLAAASAAT